MNASESIKRLHLAVFLAGDSNYHHLGWRHSEAAVDAGHNFERWREFARIAENGKLDMLFIADQIAIVGGEDLYAISNNAKVDRLEPLTLLSALAPFTKQIGLAATCATSYSEPYTVARMFGTLDHISGGRAGWNCVTGGQAEEALNFSMDRHADHGDRYERANEFVDVVLGLWNSFEHDALLYDKERGKYFDPTKVHPLRHQGKHFKVRGPLNLSRTPQGRPVIIQAGGSEATVDMASRVADVVFTAQADIVAAQAFYKSIKRRAVSYGRQPEHVKVMPGISVYVASTRREAQEKFDALHAMVDVPDAIAGLGRLMNVDLSEFDPDGPLPDFKGNQLRMSGPGSFSRIAREYSLTLGQVAIRAKASKMHGLIVGSAKDVADHMQDWLLNGAADGFNLLPPIVPGSLEDFCALVVPELQNRGLFRTDYEGDTLRANLGLPVV